MKTYDFVSIGGGSAGFNAARVARSKGLKTAIIDGAKDLGGLCILRGCMPSKTLLWATEILHRAQKGKLFGLDIPVAKANAKAMQKRKRKIIGEFASFRTEQLQSGRFDLYRNHARFLSPEVLELDDGTQIRSKHFMIATGSRVSEPPIPGLRESGYWTSDDILDLQRYPESIIVLGGGIVACELAQYLSRVGTKVTLIQRSPTLLKGFSAEAGNTLKSAMEKEGMRVFTHTEQLAISSEKGKLRVRFLDKNTGRKRSVSAERLLNALGREPAIQGLALDKAGVECEATGRIKTNRWQQTSQKHIYAGGDVSGPHDIVHLAVAQGELAAKHATGGKKLKPVSELPLLKVAFTAPAIASVGLNEREATEMNIPWEVASYPFNDHGKSILMDEMFGYVKVIAHRKTGQLLGAEIVGPEAGEMIHCFTVPLTSKLTVYDMLASPWYHPTLTEIVTYPLEELAERIQSKPSR